jgi:hypothetical protein
MIQSPKSQQIKIPELRNSNTLILLQHITTKNAQQLAYVLLFFRSDQISTRNILKYKSITKGASVAWKL